MPCGIQNLNIENNAPDVATIVTANLEKIQESLSKMAIPSARGKLFNREIKSLLNLRQPSTMVAICGSTGAGKSSLLNALLDADVVPTSSVRACTAVVTQISWNRDSEKIMADVEFLTKAEWIEELAILLSDLADPANKDNQHPNKLNGVGAMAWAKIHAMYSNVSLETLADMDADMLLQKFPHVSQLLGTEAHIEALDVKQFRQALEPYLDARETLSTGLTLVDLPGSADTNAARDKIASHFLKDCDFCWVVSPVTQAISDKVASDLLGHTFRLQLQLDGKLSTGNGITFIATKNENIKPPEVVRNLNLESDIDFQGLQEDLATCKQELRKWDEAVRAVNIDAKSTQKRISAGKDKLNGYQNDLRNRNGTATQPQENGLQDVGSKRKYFSRYQRRNTRALSSESVNAATTITWEAAQVTVEEQAPTAGMSMEELKSAICSQEEQLQQLNEELYSVTEYQQNIALGRETAFTDVQDVEKEIRAFCAIKRAAYSRYHLKDDFRGNLEEYAGQDVSSWDYMKLRAGQGSECFSSIDQTEIPALREWCHTLTRPAYVETATTLAMQFRAFALVLKTFLDDTDGVTEEDRKKMRRQWASSANQSSLCESNPGGEMRRIASLTDDALQGVILHLLKSFHGVIEDTVQGLESQFIEYLGNDCNQAAILAAAAAVKMSTKFADRKEMIWQRYRALLRRNGRFGEYDLNSELTTPFVSHIARNWARLFRSNLFRAFETATVQAVEELTNQVVQSVPEYLTSRAKKQADVSLEQTRAFVGESVTVVQRTLGAHQREISRRLAPHVQEQLKDGYQDALGITGRGSTPKQKAAVHKYIDGKKEDVFHGAADALMGGLGEAAKAIGTALEADLTLDCPSRLRAPSRSFGRDPCRTTRESKFASN
ncbi:hypothetical protein V8D89_010616 [Ganoderma adspersum]